MLTHLMIHLAVRFDLLHRSNDISSIPIYIYIYIHINILTQFIYIYYSYDNNLAYGMWGNSWRQRREFVGTVRYGVKYMLWNPETHTRMPNTHQEVVMTLLLCSRRQTCILSILPLDCVLYILNMLAPWDYSFNESVKGRKRLKNRNGNNNSSYGGRIKNVFKRLTNWYYGGEEDDDKKSRNDSNKSKKK